MPGNGEGVKRFWPYFVLLALAALLIAWWLAPGSGARPIEVTEPPYTRAFLHMTDQAMPPFTGKPFEADYVVSPPPSRITPPPDAECATWENGGLFWLYIEGNLTIAVNERIWVFCGIPEPHPEKPEPESAIIPPT